MKRPSLNPTWSLLKRKLRERYQHLTDADLMDIESQSGEWLQIMQQRIGGTPLEIAHLVAEVTEKPCISLKSGALGERERLCA